MHKFLGIKIHADKSSNSKTSKRTLRTSKNLKESPFSCHIKYDDSMERIFNRRNI
jgi:hypothetical protein